MTIPSESEATPARFSLPSNPHHTDYDEQLPAIGSSIRTTNYENGIRSMPLPPELWGAFQGACNRGASNHQLADIIKKDPVLSAAILRSVNTAGFGLRMPINDIGRAISHLGHTLVRSIVARHAFSSTTKTGKAFDAHLLWKHGMAVSALAELIAHHIPGCNCDEASTIGLFHDVGRIAFNQFAEFMLPAELDPSQGFLIYEKERFGCTHIDLGIILGRHWQLPEKIQLGIQYHHHPGHSTATEIPDAVRLEVLAVYLADMLAIHFDLGGGNPGTVEPHNSFESLMPDISLHEIIDDKRFQTELDRIIGIDF